MNSTCLRLKEFITFGIVIAYQYNIGTSYTSGPPQWRAPIASQGAVITAQVAWRSLLPETPRWPTKYIISGTEEIITTDRFHIANSIKPSTSLPDSNARAFDLPTSRSSGRKIPSTTHWLSKKPVEIQRNLQERIAQDPKAFPPGHLASSHAAAQWD